MFSSLRGYEEWAKHLSYKPIKKHRRHSCSNSVLHNRLQRCSFTTFMQFKFKKFMLLQINQNPLLLLVFQSTNKNHHEKVLWRNDSFSLFFSALVLHFLIFMKCKNETLQLQSPQKLSEDDEEARSETSSTKRKAKDEKAAFCRLCWNSSGVDGMSWLTTESATLI